MPNKLITAFIAADARKRELKQELETVKKELEELEADILTEWEPDSTTQIKVDGVLVHTHCQLWPKMEADKDEVIKALKACKYTRFLVRLGYNHQTLASRLREFPEDDEGMPKLPRRLKGVLSLSPKWSIRVKPKQ